MSRIGDPRYAQPDFGDPTSPREIALTADRDRLADVIARAADRLREIDQAGLEEARIFLSVKMPDDWSLSDAIASIEIAQRILYGASPAGPEPGEGVGDG